MLVPKRVKHRREFRGKMRGEAKGGKEVAFGEYGLQATTSHWITNRQIEAARIAMTRYMKRGCKVGLKSFLISPTLLRPSVYVWDLGKVLQKAGSQQLSVEKSCLKLLMFQKKLPVKLFALQATNYQLKLNS